MFHETYKTIVLSVVLHESETLSVISGVEHGLCLRTWWPGDYADLNGEIECHEAGENCAVRSFLTVTFRLILLG